MYAEVLLEVSIKKSLEYSIPDHLKNAIQPGTWVEVPLRNRISRGYVLTIKPESSVPKTLPISKALSDGPVITDDLFKLALWISSYYATPIEKVLKTILPSGVRKNVQPKQQYFVKRAKSRTLLSADYKQLITKAPQQAKAIEILLKARKGILLTELVEKASCHTSTISSLHQKGYVTLEKVRTDQSLLQNECYFKTTPKILRKEQQLALSSIEKTLSKEIFSTKLLFGITGSGKTEVYMQAITKALSLGKGIIMLVPEIALTTQTIQHFKSRFNEPLAILHHRLSDGARYEMWNDIRTKKRRIVIGARSAIFSPVPDLGLIIIDEEHEHSYKQTDDSPTYNARDVGIKRASLCKATILLGSATPSLESFHNTKIGKYELLTLKERSGSCILPTVHIVDMKREYEKAKGGTIFSELLLQKIEDRVQKGEQIMLFLNRRGFHTTSTCTNCHSVIKCTHCDCSLTFHRASNVLSCHLCGLEITPPRICPTCSSQSMMQHKGIGTEKVEAALKAIFPDIRVLRADADTTKHKGSMERILTGFRTYKADIMVGTQMIAKGLHFPDVTLVGVLNCDTTLQIPDFRSQESVFQLITQVSGRAGRGHGLGEVILQTTHCDHPTITTAAKQEYLSFFSDEIATRELFLFPPFTRIIKFVFQGPNEKIVASTAHEWATLLQKNLPSSYYCHPALPCGHAKIQDKWRYQCLIRGPTVTTVTSLIEQFDKKLRLPANVQRFCDVDATSTFF